MRLESIKLKGTTETDGSLTVTAPRGIFGRLYAIIWKQGTFAATADVTLSYTDEEAVSRNLLVLTDQTADDEFYPREKVHTNAGAAATGEIFDMPLIAGLPKMVIAQGGSEKTGSAILIYEPAGKG